MSDQSLPIGWSRVELGQVAGFVMGQAPPGKTCNTEGRGTPFVKAGEFGVLRPLIREWTTKPLKMASAGDVLICVVGATAGKLNLGADCAIGRSVAAIRPGPALDQRFLHLQLLPRVLEFRAGSVGSAQGVISSKDLAAIEVMLPPLVEQFRIVAALEEHLSDLDAAVAGLERTRTNVDRYRASLVRAAISGRLSSANGLRGETWREAPLGDLADVVSGQTPKGVEERARSTGEIPWIKVGDMNLEGNEREMARARAWLSEADARSLRVHVRPAGTIIFPKRGGAIATNKKRVLSRPAVFDLNTMGLVPRPGLGAWLWWWFQSVDLARLSDGSNVPQINHGDVAPLRVAVPPADERSRLVSILEERFAAADRLSADIDSQLARVSPLRQSILKRAFEGKLVSQDPSDEPAAVLLDRIRASSDTVPSPARRRRSDPTRS